MKTSPAGLSIIEKYEGDKLTAYQDGNGVWTIGYGHTMEVHIGQYETQEQAESDLCADVETAECAVLALVEVALSQNQFDALVSFTYNEGACRLKNSTLLKKLNARDFDGAAAQFLVWDIIDGQKSAGLDRRRREEMNLFTDAIQGIPIANQT